MSAPDIVAYRTQVFNFLRSMTIKYTPISDRFNALLIQAGYAVDTADPTTWKYYMNMAGQYHPVDTMMTVPSLDTQQTIDFTVENLKNNPQTAAAYVPGSDLYNQLVSRYPAQEDLIKSIVFPVPSIIDAINAPDFTILAYGDGFLESWEQDAVVERLTETLGYWTNRWYFDFLSFEPYFYWVFWGMLWQMAVGAILEARVQLLHTPYVHSFHVWQYLQSKGIADYSAILTREQSLFLYRNIDYILENRGKKSNLTILDNNILNTVGVSLVGKSIVEQTQDGADRCILTPEFQSTQIASQYADILPASPIQTVAEIVSSMYSIGAELDNSAAHVAAVTEQLGLTRANRLPTKLMEIVLLQYDKAYAAVFARFVLDTLMYVVTNNLYYPEVIFTDPYTNVEYALKASDALVFYYYCITRAAYETPVNLPTSYTYCAAYKQTYTLPTTIMFNGVLYHIRNLVDVDAFTENTQYTSFNPRLPSAFSDLASTMFTGMMHQITVSRQSCSTIIDTAVESLLDAMTVRGTVPISLSTYTSYAQWSVADSSNVSELLAAYETAASPEDLYAALSDVIMTALIPLTDTMREYGTFTDTTALFKSLKGLFVQLTSYQILLLDTESTSDLYLYDGKTNLTPVATDGTDVVGMYEADDHSNTSVGTDSIDVPDPDELMTTTSVSTDSTDFPVNEVLTTSVTGDETTNVLQALMLEPEQVTGTDSVMLLDFYVNLSA